jgi:hypothetical protein
VVAGACGVLVLIVALAFLLGRQSARPAAAPAAASSVTPVAATPLAGAAQPVASPAAVAPAADPTPDALAATGAPSASAAVAQAAPPLDQAPAPAPAASHFAAATLPPASAAEPPAAAVGASAAAAPAVAAPADAVERDSVSRYFRDVESIQQRGKYWNDPQALARSLVDQAAKGDGSGFDELLASNRRVRDDLAGVSVPAPCSEHHRVSVALIEESLGLLAQLKGSTLSHDERALTALATAAKSIEARAREADALAQAIKRRFGL